MDAVSGVVRTKGSQPFRLGKEYEIGVSAQDINAKTPQKSATHSLKILVGEREPQFYETQYIANVPETADEQYKWAIRHFKIFKMFMVDINHKVTNNIETKWLQLYFQSKVQLMPDNLNCLQKK